MDVASIPTPYSSLTRTVRTALGWSASIGVHLLFAYTAWHLFWFLRDGVPTHEGQGKLAIDIALALQFAVPHSWLLLPSTRKLLSRWVTPHFYGLLFTFATCASLLLVFAFWQGCGPHLWRATGTSAWIIRGCFYGSWVALVYSLWLTGLGYQTGLTPWTYWVRGQKVPRREFTPRGAYRCMRHPVYLSFLGLIWFTPHMTLDHAILTSIWTAYIFVGSYLKDERLAFYLGETYRAYQRQVPGYLVRVGWRS